MCVNIFLSARRGLLLLALLSLAVFILPAQTSGESAPTTNTESSNQSEPEPSLTDLCDSLLTELDVLDADWSKLSATLNELKIQSLALEYSLSQSLSQLQTLTESLEAERAQAKKALDALERVTWERNALAYGSIGFVVAGGLAGAGLYYLLTR